MEAREGLVWGTVSCSELIEPLDFWREPSVGRSCWCTKESELYCVGSGMHQKPLNSRMIIGFGSCLFLRSQH